VLIVGDRRPARRAAARARDPRVVELGGRHLDWSVLRAGTVTM
jgi:hypothetical protein